MNKTTTHYLSWISASSGKMMANKKCKSVRKQPNRLTNCSITKVTTSLLKEEQREKIIQMCKTALQKPRIPEKGNMLPLPQSPTKWILMQLYKKVPDHSNHNTTINKSYENNKITVNQNISETTNRLL